MSAEKVEQLDRIGFDWTPDETVWDDMFETLCQFKEENGHFEVPAKYAPNKKFGAWVSTQRVVYKEKKLAKDKISRLESIGFVWDVIEEKWEKWFSQLSEFKQKEGHCRVPHEHEGLGRWVTKQRGRHKELSEDKIKCLNRLGFVWDIKEGQWLEYYNELCQFVEINGHTNVGGNNRPLQAWMTRCRTKPLSEEKTALLNGIGFVWDLKQDFWDKKFAALLEFKNKHGSCNVPSTYTEDPSLATWVIGRRVRWRNEQLTEEQIQSLDEVGFVWEPYKQKR